jgi:hypothetical protein
VDYKLPLVHIQVGHNLGVMDVLLQ